MLAQYLLLLVATGRLALMITLLFLPCCDDQRVGLEQPNVVDAYVTCSLACVCPNLALLTDSFAASLADSFAARLLEFSLATDTQGQS